MQDMLVQADKLAFTAMRTRNGLRSNKCFFVYNWPEFANPLLQYSGLLETGTAGATKSLLLEDHHGNPFPSYLLKQCEEYIRRTPHRGSGDILPGEIPTYNTDMNSLFIHLYERFTTSSRRTFNAEEANAYLIPYDIAGDTAFGDDVRNLPGCAMARDLQERLESSPAFNQTGGADHYIIVSSLLSQFITRAACVHYLEHFCRKCSVITIEDALGDTQWNIRNSLFYQQYTEMSRTGRIVVVPYPSAYHFPPEWVAPHWVTDSTRINRRTTTVIFIGNVLTSVRYRSVLQTICAIHHPQCRWVDTARQGFKSNMTQLYHESVFCFIPRGHTYSRKALIDSLMAGCIPVVFHVETLHTLYPLFIDIPTALAMSVYFPHYKLDEAEGSPFNCSLINYLIDIRDGDEVYLKRHVISSVLKRLQYSLPVVENRPADSPDAFDVLVDYMVA